VSWLETGCCDLMPSTTLESKQNLKFLFGSANQNMTCVGHEENTQQNLKFLFDSANQNMTCVGHEENTRRIAFFLDQTQGKDKIDDETLLTQN
jgi:hypothetical protein